MKRILISILFCLLTFSQSDSMVLVSGGAHCDNCSDATQFAWHMEDNDSTPDVTIGRPCGCSDGDKIGAQTGSPTFSTAQKFDGSYSLYINALGEYYTFDISSNDIIDIDSAKITFNLYIVSFPATGCCPFTFTDAFDTNLITLCIDSGSSTMTFYRTGNEVLSNISISSVSTGTWLSCEYQVKTGVTGNDTYLNCSGNSNEEDDDNTPKGGSPTIFSIGEISTDDAGEYYIDNIKVAPSDRY